MHFYYWPQLIVIFLWEMSLILPTKNEKCDGEQNNCWALTPYVEHYPLPKFSEKLNEIIIGGEKFILHQSWKSIGVAGVVWDCSITLSEYLHNNPFLVANKTVLELGAGTGLPSIIAAKLGAKVTSTDVPKALDILRRNIMDNVKKHSVQIEPLIWGKKNNNNNSNLKLFDVILGADLVYDESVFDDLLETLNEHSDVSSAVYLAVRVRYKRDEKFLDKLKHYFIVEEKFYDNVRDVRVMLCRKRTK